MTRHCGNSHAVWDHTVLPAAQQRSHSCLYHSQLRLVLNLSTMEGCKAELLVLPDNRSTDFLCLQCFDAVGWAAGKASGLSGGMLAWLSGASCRFSYGPAYATAPVNPD